MVDFIHIYDVLATSILETLSPTRCVVCDLPGDILCPQCASGLPFINFATACPRCGAPYGRRLCTECPQPGCEDLVTGKAEALPFTHARSALSFEGGARKIIRAYKDQDELRLDAVIASFICSAIRLSQMGRSFDPSSMGFSRLWTRRSGPMNHFGKQSNDCDWSSWADALVFIPASPEALLRRDFDHMERVAKICARRLGLPVMHALATGRGASDQRKLGRSERLANRSGSFSLAPNVPRLPARVILIDDVLTTGATTSAATQVLLDGGVQEVRVVTCCRVW